jgi:hypothetical protein
VVRTELLGGPRTTKLLKKVLRDAGLSSQAFELARMRLQLGFDATGSERLWRLPDPQPWEQEPEPDWEEEMPL